jgi:hypothetical protein
MNKKKTATSGKLIKAVYAFLRLCLYLFVQVSPIGYSIIGLGVWGVRGNEGKVCQ